MLGVNVSSIAALLKSIEAADLRRVAAVAGNVTTMMFTDIVDSVALKAAMGDAKFLELLERHHDVVRRASSENNGLEIKTMGDAFFIAFARPQDAVTAAFEIQNQLVDSPIATSEGKRLQVRIGLHSGAPITVMDSESGRPDLLGIAVDCAARVMSLAAGSQVLASEATVILAQPVQAHDWGPFELKGMPSATRIFELLWRAGQTPKTPMRLPVAVPRPTIPRLFGIEAYVDAMRSVLEDDSDAAAAVVSVEGVGGIGKTAVAEATLQRVLQSSVFEQVAWYEVRPGGFENLRNADLPKRLPLELDALVSNIASQLELWTLATSAAPNRIPELAQALRRRRSMIVIDNIETTADIAPLGELLRHADAFRPSRLLITSRISLASEAVRLIGIAPVVFQQRIDELGEEQSIALLRHESVIRNLQEVAGADSHILAQIHRAVGGNPQALRLSLGLLRTRPIDVVCRELEGQASGPTEALFEFIYGAAWATLTEDARILLNSMPMFSGEGADWARLHAVSEMEMDRLSTTVELLTSMSLLVVKGGLDSRRYSIHRLTEQFLKKARKDSLNLGRQFAEAMRRNIAYSQVIVQESP